MHIFSPPSSYYWSRGAAGQRQQDCGLWRATRAAGGSGEGRRCAGGRSWACSWWRPCRCQQNVKDDARSKWGCGGSWRDSRTACWRHPLSPSYQDTSTPSRLVLTGEQKSSGLLSITSWFPSLWSTLWQQLEMQDHAEPVGVKMWQVEHQNV